MNCETIQSDLSAYLDKELSSSRLQEVELHLGTCSDCQELLQLLDSTRTTFREYKPAKVSSGFQQEVKDAINETASRPDRQWLRWAAPLALAASLAIMFFWNEGDVVPVFPSDPTGPMSGQEIYEQILTSDESPGLNTNPKSPGLDPDDSIPGMGNYYIQMPGSSS